MFNSYGLLVLHFAVERAILLLLALQDLAHLNLVPLKVDDSSLIELQIDLFLPLELLKVSLLLFLEFQGVLGAAP